jgi:D-alanyl-D-alanine carboxypeptidase
MKRYRIVIVLSMLVLGLFAFGSATHAADQMWLHFDTATIKRGYTAEYNAPAGGGWGTFRLAIVPDLVNEPVNLNLKTFNCKELPDPGNGLRRVSDCFIYDILREQQQDKSPLKLNRPFILSMKIEDPQNYYRKQIYYWNKPRQTWVPLPSSADYEHGYIRAYTHLPFSRVAVFEDSATTVGYGIEGVTSWYRDTRHPYGAASNDYPLGTKLHVRNVDSGKVVDVEVTSTGPFLPFASRRVLDLSLTAFNQIEERGKGLARIQIWPVTGIVLGAETHAPAETKPVTLSVPEPHPQSAAVVSIKLSENERIKDILYSKNYDQVRSIASLTKLMTAAVFLDTNTPMDKVITYEAGDNTNPAGSRLNVAPGETMTVKDLYFTMLVGSANNAAKALARSTGLSQEEFVRRMNAKAKGWGLAHTHFVEPTGLDPQNVSTVYEVALMAKQAFNRFAILQGTMTPVYGFRTINTSQPHTIKSTETEMFSSPLRLTGMKTGYLNEANYCFVLKARPGDEGTDHDVITVVLGASTRSQSFQETTDVMNYALSLF